MNINIFFITLGIVLSMIFFLFKPMDIKQQEFKDTPVFEIDAFTVHELDNNGLVSFMKGSRAFRYDSRYEVTDIDYTDNSKQYIANMRANSGFYKDKENTVRLKGDVFYSREDGLSFETQEIFYDKNTSVVKSDTSYILYQGANEVRGSSLSYNNILDKIESKNIVAKYQLKER